MNRCQLITSTLLLSLTLLSLTACGDASDEDGASESNDADVGDVDAGSNDDATPADDGEDAATGGVVIETLVDNVRLPILGVVAELTFEAPEDVLSLTVIVHGEPDGWYGVDSWIDGDGTALATSDWPAEPGNERGCFSCRNFITQGPGVSANVAPNRDSGAVHPGTHRLELVGWEGGFAADAVQVTVLAKRGPSLPERGVLDLNFYLTGAQGWTADTVADDRYFQACLDRVAEVFEEVGITLGELTFFDIDPSYATVSIAPDNDTLGALMATSRLEQKAGLNIFFVDQILTGEPDFPSIPGVSASVPNPPWMPGTVASGVAVATRGPLEVPPGQRFLDPPAIGQTIAHELGHALGMFHTSEYDEVSHDHFDDTPTNDNAYLMHADGTGAIISPAQGRAMRANPVVRHPLQP